MDPEDERFTVRPLDAREWAGLIERSPHPSFLQDEPWGELKTRFGWRALRLGAVDGDGTAQAGLQLLTRAAQPLKFLPGAGIAYVPRGPIGLAPLEAIGPLLDETVRVAAGTGASFLRVEPTAEYFDTVGPVLAGLGFTRTRQYVQIRATGYVDLRPAEEQILAGFKSKTRYNVRLAGRRGVEVRTATAGADLDSFYGMTVVTGRRDGFAVHGQEYYDAVWETYRPDAGQLLIAGVEGRDVAALFAVRCGSVATYLYGASTGAHRRAMPNYMLQWEAMRWGRAQGCETYDLWGLGDPEIEDDPMAGVNRFKEGFQPRRVLHPGAYDRPLNQLSYLVLTRVLMPARAAWQSIRSGRATAPPPG